MWLFVRRLFVSGFFSRSASFTLARVPALGQTAVHALRKRVKRFNSESGYYASVGIIDARREYLSEKNVKILLVQLQQALAEGGAVDDETLAMAKKLDKEISAYIASAENVNSPVLDDAIALEARFAANHPVAERLIRELIDSLGRIGI